MFLLWAAALAIKRKFYDKKEAVIQLEEDDDVVVVEEGYVQMEGGGTKSDERPVSPITKDEGDVVVVEQKQGYQSMEDSKS